MKITFAAGKGLRLIALERRNGSYLIVGDTVGRFHACETYLGIKTGLRCKEGAFQTQEMHNADNP